MKRITSLVLAVLALTIVTAIAVQAQESYPQGTTAQQTPSGTTTDQTAPTTTTDPAAQTPATDMPATATPMPLVGLGGLGALGLGSLLNRSRRRA
jgi:hypothetical protein